MPKRPLLVFMTTYLMQPDGSLDVFSTKEAEAWNHLFVASAYFFSVLGGLLADAFLGKYLTIYNTFVGLLLLATVAWLLWD